MGLLVDMYAGISDVELVISLDTRDADMVVTEMLLTVELEVSVAIFEVPIVVNSGTIPCVDANVDTLEVCARVAPLVVVIRIGVVVCVAFARLTGTMPVI